MWPCEVRIWLIECVQYGALALARLYGAGGGMTSVSEMQSPPFVVKHFLAALLTPEKPEPRLTQILKTRTPIDPNFKNPHLTRHSCLDRLTHMAIKLRRPAFNAPIAVHAQGGQTVVRDATTNRVLTAADTVKATKAVAKTWRAKLKELTNDGELLDLNALAIANGQVRTYVNPVTGATTVQVPSCDTQLEATRYLTERIHGKAVNQAEVQDTEVNEARSAMLAALSEEKLLEIIEGEYKVLENGANPSDPPSDE